MTINEDEQKQELRYYGKKLYKINPLLARRRPVKEKNPDYSTDEMNPQKQARDG